MSSILSINPEAPDPEALRAAAEAVRRGTGVLPVNSAMWLNGAVAACGAI